MISHFAFSDNWQKESYDEIIKMKILKTARYLSTNLRFFIVATCALQALSKAHALHALFDHPRTEGNVRYSIFVESISYFCPEG